MLQRQNMIHAANDSVLLQQYYLYIMQSNISFLCFCLHKDFVLTYLYSVVLYKIQGPLDCSSVLFFGFTLNRNMRDIDHLLL